MCHRWLATILFMLVCLPAACGGRSHRDARPDFALGTAANAGMAGAAAAGGDASGSAGAPTGQAGIGVSGQAGAGRCGDGIMTTPEECDDGNAATEACAYGRTACTVCAAGCIKQPGEVSGYCGDGVVNGPEDCEGTDPVDVTCADLGFDLGTVRCSSRCIPILSAAQHLGTAESAPAAGARCRAVR